MFDLTADYLREHLAYDPETGVFVWIKKTGPGVRVGRIAGRVNGKGYASISLGNKHHAAHRLAWLYMTGEWPATCVHIDHINGIKNDNRFVNLRLATPSQNAANRIKLIENPKGVSLHKNGKWQAQISKNGKCFYLGTFSDIEKASAAYATAASKMFGVFARVT